MRWVKFNHIFHRRDPNLNLEITTAKELIAQMQSQMQIFTLLLASVGSISLVVGGIGIMKHHSGVGCRATPGDRRPTCAWGATMGYSKPVSDRVGDSNCSRRHPRCPAWTRSDVCDLPVCQLGFCHIVDFSGERNRHRGSHGAIFRFPACSSSLTIESDRSSSRGVSEEASDL